MRKTKIAAVVAASMVIGGILLPAASASAWNNVYYDGEYRCSGTYYKVVMTTRESYEARHEIYDGVGAYVNQWGGTSAQATHTTIGPAYYSSDQTTAWNGTRTIYNRHCGF